MEKSFEIAALAAMLYRPEIGGEGPATAIELAATLLNLGEKKAAEIVNERTKGEITKYTPEAKRDTKIAVS